MLTVIVSGPTFREAEEQVVKGNSLGDCLEFRLDAFNFAEFDNVRRLRNKAQLPVIFTFRKASQGGLSNLKEPERLMAIQQFASLMPDYIDIEYDVEVAFFGKIKSLFPNVAIISSYHNYDETPIDLPAVWAAMQNPHASIYKIATWANSSLDSLRMLKFLKESQAENGKIVGLCMGDLGQMTRVLGRVFGSFLTYCPADIRHCTAPGQIDVETMKQIYQADSQNSNTQVFGLIGDPVEQSLSDLTHNRAFFELGLNAVYVKMRVTKEETNSFLRLAKELGIRGLSVTMPLKEEVLRTIDLFCPGSEEIGAINTLHFTENGIVGLNTDGGAALDLIEAKLPVVGKTVIVIGAGGAAKAITFEAMRRGASLCIINRTTNKAEELASKLGCAWGGFADFAELAEKGYDVIVNATSISRSEEKLPFMNDLLAGSVAMDVVSTPVETSFLMGARARGCQAVYGFEMFLRQAVKQFELWFGDVLDYRKVRKCLEQAILQAKK